MSHSSYLTPVSILAWQNAKSWVLAVVLNLTNIDGSYFMFQWILLAFLQLGSAVVKISWPSGKCVVENCFQWLLSLVANCIPRKTFNEICEGSVRTRGHQWAPAYCYHKRWSDMVSISIWSSSVKYEAKVRNQLLGTKNRMPETRVESECSQAQWCCHQTLIGIKRLSYMVSKGSNVSCA